jgi:Cdc25 family phosphatase
VNHPAFVFEAEIDKMVEKYKRSPKLIFHCRHSQIRGPQCATLFSERLHALYPEESHRTRVFLLQDGFEGWIFRYGAGNPLLVEDFHASVWKDTLEGISPLKKMMYTRFDPKDEK